MNVFYNVGYTAGHTTGSTVGYDLGFDSSYGTGFTAGYDVGYTDGFHDYSFAAVQEAKTAEVKMASMVSSDLISYEKMEKFNPKTALEGSRITLDRGSNQVQDMEKLGALKERHYLGQMQKQLVNRYGLSALSSAKVAKLVHGWNKISSSRELTAKDAEAFSKTLIGSSMNEVEAAVKKTLTGDLSDLNSRIDTAASNLGTTPEQMRKMVYQIFF